MHQPELERLIGGDDAAAHEEVHRPRDAEELHEQKLTTFVRHQPEAHGCTAETRFGRRDTEVAGERQRQAGLNCHAVDGSDSELVEVPHDGVQRLREPAKPFVRADGITMPGRDAREECFGGAVVRRPAGDVVAGRERAARAGDDDDADGVVHLRLHQHFDEVALEGLGHAVQPVWLVEGEHGNARRVQFGLKAAEGAGEHG